MALAELQRQKKLDEENRKERMTKLAESIRSKDQASRSKRAETLSREKATVDLKLISIDK